MLYCSFSLTNPWYKNKGGSHKSLFLYHGRLYKNKYWELECIRDPQRILAAELSFSWRNRDHAGLNMGVCILGADIALHIYDTRHWDYQNNKWEETELNKEIRTDLGFQASSHNSDNSENSDNSDNTNPVPTKKSNDY